ncbi:hypothetical protein FVEG_17310 [Fusarium verticillioides 7600]|uniref:Uncharacterized protein n=1 Tax=Gibberella moniliformis (strain M3125 / FGSC 7600) TaxID=334819 RepID=W7MSG2_GIBM7|nr:hypothetical protein FVEG_17310 [Fusarium verticillioides 7600]EWG54388.1 hypothetical protein FVEG_17310 [Fusarium verticillioides 7600]RBQ97419.1 hypothetical protein FVER53263_20673 [Fusarium verticillioides]
MLIFKSIILSCLLFGAVQGLAAQQKATDPKNDKPTNQPHLAKRSMTNKDRPTDQPQLAKRTVTKDHAKLARRTIDKPTKPTIHPRLVEHLMHERFNESLA